MPTFSPTIACCAMAAAFTSGPDEHRVHGGYEAGAVSRMGSTPFTQMLRGQGPRSIEICCCRAVPSGHAKGVRGLRLIRMPCEARSPRNTKKKLYPAWADVSTRRHSKVERRDVRNVHDSPAMGTTAPCGRHSRCG